MEIKGKYVTAIIYTDNIEGTALHQIEGCAIRNFTISIHAPRVGATKEMK